MFSEEERRAIGLLLSEENIRKLERSLEEYEKKGSYDGAAYGKACYAAGFADAAGRAERKMRRDRGLPGEAKGGEMKIKRAEFYFEPRVVDDGAGIRWYGERYDAPELSDNAEETVYVRDNGEELYIYEMYEDKSEDARHIKAEFRLTAKIKKNSEGHRYGK